MKSGAIGLTVLVGVLALSLGGAPVRAADKDATALAGRARDVLKTHCYRCHGQDGTVEGGMSYILDRERLIARAKIIPGSAAKSPLFKRVEGGKMPPPGESPRPGEAEIAILKKWIDTGAAADDAPAPLRKLISDSEVHAHILADLDRMDRRTRRFARYFSIAPQYNAGLAEDELSSYRIALSQLLNSLSWHPRIAVPRAIDPARVILRLDLRDYQWDANLWDRVLTEYPYGVTPDSAAARACMVHTLTRLPVVRADWFLATACRPPLYQDLLQLPTNAAELERQLRVDVAVDIQQERIARAGFNGSGVSRNNRVLERHDSVLGVYWRTYDFDAVPQNLLERDILLPDRRNLFAYPLGPGAGDNTFQHAGGEIIFSLPNALHGFMLINANGTRVDKAPAAIVSDPKRPDRQVETGISCMSCHVRGINQKSDQIRDHVAKNPKVFSKADSEIIRALYVPEAKLKALMDEDADRYRKAVEKCGGRINVTAPITTLTLRYEADVDLPTAAGEVGLTPDEFVARLSSADLVSRSLGAFKTSGGTVHRPVWVQAFGDMARELRMGIIVQPGASGQRLPDNSGEIDPLEAQSSPANSAAFSPDGSRALFASADKSVRLWNVESGRDIRRFVGHTASVWAVAFSPDGKRALSGGADQTVRLWDVNTGRELRRFTGHEGLVVSVAFSPDGRQALSGAYDHTVILWDLESGREIKSFKDIGRYINCVVFAPDGRHAIIGGESSLHSIDPTTGRIARTYTGHTGPITCAVFSADGKRLLSASDDGTMRLWDTTRTAKLLRTFQGQAGSVKCIAFSRDLRTVLSGGSDGTVRLWDVETGKERKRLGEHKQPLVAVAFSPDGGEALSCSRDAIVRVWSVK